MTTTTKRATIAGLALLPIIWVVVNIRLWGLNLPFWDQWEFVPTLVKSYQGTLTLGDLLAQHNEHRPVFPRLLWITLAWLTNYSVNAELWLNFLIAATTLVVFLLYTSRLWNSNDVPDAVLYLAIPLFSLLIFNMVQWESWLFGFQTVMFLGIGCVVAGFLVLGNHRNWTGLVVAALLGIVATYSMGNALLYWPIGLLLILIAPGSRSQLWRIVAWSGTGVAAAAVYLWGWTSAQMNAANILALQPLAYVHWLLNFLGAPLLAYSPALLLGLMSLAILIGVTIQIRKGLTIVSVGPYLAICAFVVGSGLVIGLGRSYGGPGLALAPRYIAQTSWYWAALFAMVPLLRLKRRYWLAGIALATVLLILSTAGGAVSGYKWRYLRTLPAYEAVRAGADPTDEELSNIYGDKEPGETRARLAIVCSYRWSACADRY